MEERRGEAMNSYLLFKIDITCQRYLCIREDEITRGTSFIGSYGLALLRSKHSTSNILEKISIDEISEGQEVCFCGASVKVRGAKGCLRETLSKVLPCGQVGAYYCGAGHFQDGKINEYPVCSIPIRIFRIEVQDRQQRSLKIRVIRRENFPGRKFG
jgi:hypothetical protein